MKPNLVKEAAKRAAAELEDYYKVDPTLRKKMEAEGRAGMSRMTIDERLDDPRRGQGTRRKP